MPTGFQALAIMLVLLPGLLAAYIVQFLANRSKQSDTEKVIEALILSFLVYVISSRFVGMTLPATLHITTNPDGSKAYELMAQWGRIATITVIAIALGILWAFLLNSDWVTRFFRLIRVTERTTRSSTWNDVFQDIGGVVQVEMANGKSVMGYVSYYSDDCSLFLSHAAWVADDGITLEKINGAGILIPKNGEISSVMFLEPEKPADESETT